MKILHNRDKNQTPIDGKWYNGIAARNINRLLEQKKLANRYIDKNYNNEKVKKTELDKIKIKPPKILNYSQTLDVIKEGIVLNLNREKKQFNKNDTELIEFYKTLALYFSEDEKFEEKYIIRNNKKKFFDLQKGILITGVPGRGKSFAMRLFQKFTEQYNTHKHFEHLYIDSMANEVRRTKELNVLYKYRRKSILLDELGSDKAKVHYNQVFLSEQFILDRHRIFIHQKKFKTHAISNLRAMDFKNKLEKHAYDRIFELFNIIDLTKDISYR